MQIIQSLLLRVLIYSMLIDPTNTLLGIKLYAFVLFFLSVSGRLKVSLIRVMPIISYYFVVTVGTVVIITNDVSYDPEFLVNYFTTGSTLLLLLCLDQKLLHLAIKYFIQACIIISILTIFIFTYFQLTDISLIWNVDFYDTFIVTPRAFAGVHFLMVYHKSIGAVIIALAIILNRTLYQGIDFNKIILCCLFAFALFCSATRANLLSLVALSLVFLIFSLKNKGMISKIRTT